MFIFNLTTPQKNNGHTSIKAEKNTVQKNFSVALSTLLSETNTTQAELAKYLGVTRQSISQYVSNKSIPDIYIFRKIAKFFNVTYEYLLGETKSKERANIEINQKIGFSDKNINTLINITNQTGVGYNVINDFLDNIGLYSLACEISEIKYMINNTINNISAAENSAPGGEGMFKYVDNTYNENEQINSTISENNYVITSIDYIDFLMAKLEKRIIQSIKNSTKYDKLEQLKKDTMYASFVPATEQHLNQNKKG